VKPFGVLSHTVALSGQHALVPNVTQWWSLPQHLKGKPMKKLALAVVISSLMPLAAYACDGMQKTADAKKAEPKKLSVTELASLTKEKKATAVDVNTPDTRDDEGTIPGALMLTSSGKYDVKELPNDKASKLVFYCYNEQCGASHSAAQRAIEAGYKDVALLPAGIVGWKKAGQTTSSTKTKS
jgi:rhodanese-related sulfurtransferase